VVAVASLHVATCGSSLLEVEVHSSCWHLRVERVSVEIHLNVVGGHHLGNGAHHLVDIAKDRVYELLGITNVGVTIHKCISLPKVKLEVVVLLLLLLLLLLSSLICMSSMVSLLVRVVLLLVMMVAAGLLLVLWLVVSALPLSATCSSRILLMSGPVVMLLLLLELLELFLFLFI